MQRVNMFLCFFYLSSHRKVFAAATECDADAIKEILAQVKCKSINRKTQSYLSPFYIQSGTLAFISHTVIYRTKTLRFVKMSLFPHVDINGVFCSEVLVSIATEFAF